MAQFGKHLFGSSYFGKTNTFDGEYKTAVIDAGEPFTGSVHVALVANLPTLTYEATNPEWVFTDSLQWTVSGTTANTNILGASAKLLACGSSFAISCLSGAGRGALSVSLLNLETNVVQAQTLNTAVTGTLSFAVPYGNYLLTVTTTNALPVKLYGVTVAVTAIGADIRTATSRIPVDANGETYNWGAFVPVALTYNSYTQKYEGDSASVTDQTFIEARLHLTTSDSLATPAIDAIVLSSDDISKYAADGYWYAALNLNNIASDAGVVFAKTKRLEWKETQTEAGTLELRSTSIPGDSLETIPSPTEVLSATYWQPETAVYLVDRSDALLPYGKPYGRASLGEAGNDFAVSRTHSYLLAGPINASQAGFSNTKAVDWSAWENQISYPTNKNDTGIIYELYPTKEAALAGMTPLATITRPEDAKDKLIAIDSENFSETVYLRIDLRRGTGRQSPVVDYVDLKARLHYESPSAAGVYKDTLCGLDNSALATTEADLGKRLLRTIPHALFDWPSLSQSLPENGLSLQRSLCRLKLAYNPRYAGVHIGLGETLEEAVAYQATSAPEWSLRSKVTVTHPSASANEVPANGLYWHYNYDGGTVNYPSETERDLATDFTPNLLPGKTYRFRLSNGWKQETFQLPFALTWDELAEMVDETVAELQAVNPNVKLYQGKLSMGFVVNLPNHSENELISLYFKSNEGVLTESSLWNGTGILNDSIVAYIPDSGTYKSVDWVSEEVIYNGILNQNNTNAAYVRIQLASYQARAESTYIVGDTELSANEIALLKNVSVADLVQLNAEKTTFLPGESVLIPGSFTLPVVDARVIYEGEHPYVAEIIPHSVYRTKDRVHLPEDILLFHSDDEPGLTVTMATSPPMAVSLTRGGIANGMEAIPYSNVSAVTSIRNDVTGIFYMPYQNNGGVESGDYILDGNTIDWSPSQVSASEPTAGQSYTVTFTANLIDTIKIIYTSDYKERTAYDKLWRSETIVEISDTVGVAADKQIALPEKTAFAGYNALALTNVQYVVEDNDLWVQTTIKETEGETYLLASLNGEDPKRNWYPTVQTGFYYLNDQEYYLYSEPLTHLYGEEAVPVIADVTYNEKGLSLV